MKRLASMLYTVIAVFALAPYSAGAATAPAVGAGNGISAVLKADGTLWTWGKNDLGQLGNKSSATLSYSPVQALISDVTAVSVGYAHMLAIKSDKSVWAWGNNDSAQFGNNKTSNSNKPVQVTGLADVAAVRAGRYGSAALKTDGTVWAWGKNNYGQLGNGTFTDSKIPVRVTGLSNVTAIAVGDYHMLALRADGSVWAWGLNDFGQLGNGTYTLSSIPLQVQVSKIGDPVVYLSDVAAISCGGFHSMAVLTDGSVRAWGDGANGQLGIGESRAYGYSIPEAVVGTPTDAPVAATVDNPTPTSAISQTTVTFNKTINADSTVTIVKTSVVTDSTGTHTTTTTTTMPMLSGVVALAAGNANTAVLMTDGSVRAWGFNGGRLGNSTPDTPDDANSDFPVKVTAAAVGAPAMNTIAAGFGHMLAIGADNKIWTWGINSSGELGIGSANADYHFPVVVAGFDGKDFLITTVSTTTPTTPTPTTTPTTPTVTQTTCSPPSDSDADRIFNWAESKYAAYFFPPPAASQDGGGYRYRYYSGSNTYLGYKEGTVYHYDPAKWGAIMSLGRSCIFLEQAKAAGF